MQHQTISRPISLVSVAALADAALLAQWETHLLPLVQAGQITCWSERHLQVGVDRLAQVLEHLAQAQGVVLLLSADFFASDECMACLERVLSCHQTKLSVVIPLLLRPVVWQELALRSFQCLPASGLPVIQWPSRDEAFHACVQELRVLLHLAPIPAPEEALYRDHVVKAYNWLNFAGFGQGDLTLASVSLEDIFVRLHLTVERVSWEPESHHEKHVPAWQHKQGSRSSKNTSKKRKDSGQHARVVRAYEPIALVDALKTNLLVVGEPGAGKSILLRWLAITFAQKRQSEPTRLGPLAERDQLPIMVELGQLPAPYLQAEGGEWPNWLQLLPTLLSGQQSFPGISAHFVTQALQTGQCLLLFDGLDEIAHEQVRLRIAQSIAELARLFPQHRILVGSRPAGLSGSEGALHGFRRCDIVRMTPEDVLRFLERWYALDQSCPPQQRESDADALYTRLQATPGLLELARTPLLCTILLLIWRNEQELPRRRVEIYKKCCQTLLTSWERHHGVQARGLLATLGWEQQFHLLALLAYTIHCRGQQTTTSRKDLLDELKKSILAAGFFTQEQEAAHAAEQFLDWLALRSGLLHHLGNDQYRFPHQTFQEYLAACYIAEQPSPICSDLVMEHLHESWWREVHLLTIGQLGSEREGAGKAEQLLLTILRASPLPWWLWGILGVRPLCLMKPGWGVALLGIIIVTSGFLLEWLAHIPILLFLIAIIILKRVTPPRSYFPDMLWKHHIAWLLCREVELVVSGYQECHPETVFGQVDKELRARISSQISRLFCNDASRAMIQSLLPKLLQVSGIEMDVTKMLLRGLYEENPYDVREAAAKSLGRTVDAHPEVVNALLKVLQDRYEYSSVREAAASSLGLAVGSHPEVVKALLEVLHEQDLDVEPGAIAISLGQAASSYPQALDALLEASRDHRWAMREAAVSNLGQVARSDPRVMKKLLKFWLHPQAGLSWYAAISLEQAINAQPGGSSALLELLHDENEDRDVREASARYLGQSMASHPEVTKALLSLLHHQEPYMRKVAASSLGQAASRNSAVVKALREALDDQDGGVCRAAVSSLGEAASSQPEALDTLLETLHHQNKGMCQVAASSLKQAASGHQEVVHALLEASSDQSEEVREAAAESLSWSASLLPEVVNGLLKSLYARSEEVRRTAVLSLEEATDLLSKMVNEPLKSLRNLSEERTERWATARYLGCVMGSHPEVARALLGMLCEQDKQTRETSTHHLEQGAGCYPEVVKVLLEMLHDQDGDIREAAARNLGDAAVSYPVVIEALLKALHDEDQDVRRAAATCLGPAAGCQPSVLKTLLKALHHQEGDICLAAVSNLGPIASHQPEGIKALLDALHDRNPHVRLIAARSLGRQELHDPVLLLQIVKRLNRCTYDRWEPLCTAAVASLRQLLDGRPMSY